MRIIFMGTPEFAVPSLKILVENNCNVVAVITAPDKPAGRGKKILTSAVKDFALEHSIPILQPPKLKNKAFLEELKSYQADLQVVVAFRMLPELVWNMPPMGTINLHAALLPKYRGAAPINWAIINGETETGISTFFLRHKIDTGNIIFQEKEAILPEDNVGTLYERLMHKGAKLVLKTVKAIEKGAYPEQAQDLNLDMPAAPKIFREHCEINWKKTSIEIHNFVRGLSPYPAAWIILKEKSCKIYQTSLDVSKLSEKRDAIGIGKYLTDNKSYLYFKTADGWIAIEELQLQGKKRMNIQAFLAGNKL